MEITNAWLLMNLPDHDKVDAFHSLITVQSGFSLVSARPLVATRFIGEHKLSFISTSKDIAPSR